MYINQIDSAPRIKPTDPRMAKGKAKELLDAVVNKYGGAPNSFKTKAHSPADDYDGSRGRGAVNLPDAKRLVFRPTFS